MSDSEVEGIFKYITKTVKTIGVTISINKFTESVFRAVDALLIEKMKDAVVKSLKPFQELFAKYDTNKDHFLEYQEFENLLLECQVAFKPNMLSRIYTMLDQNKKRKISFESIKFYLNDGFSSTVAGAIARSMDIEPSLERSSISMETTSEELNIIKSGARKILSACQNNLYDYLIAKDKHNEGIISSEEVMRTIEEQKVPELKPSELNLLVKYCDKGNKGFISV